MLNSGPVGKFKTKNGYARPYAYWPNNSNLRQSTSYLNPNTPVRGKRILNRLPFQGVNGTGNIYTAEFLQVDTSPVYYLKMSDVVPVYDAIPARSQTRNDTGETVVVPSSSSSEPISVSASFTNMAKRNAVFGSVLGFGLSMLFLVANQKVRAKPLMVIVPTITVCVLGGILIAGSQKITDKIIA